MDTSSSPSDLSSQHDVSDGIRALPKDTAEDDTGLPPDYEQASFLRPITAEALNSRYRNDRMCVTSHPHSIDVLTSLQTRCYERHDKSRSGFVRCRYNDAIFELVLTRHDT